MENGKQWDNWFMGLYKKIVPRIITDKNSDKESEKLEDSRLDDSVISKSIMNMSMLSKTIGSKS